MDRELANDIKKKLNIHDSNVGLKIEKLAELECGQEILAVIRNVVNHPSKRTGYEAAASRINFPSRPPTKKELQDQLTQEIKFTAFTESVLHVIKMHLDKKEQKLLAKEMEGFDAHCAAICGPSKIALMDKAVDLAASSADRMGNGVKDFAATSEYLHPRAALEDSEQMRLPSRCMELIGHITEPVMERENKTKGKTSADGKSIGQEDRYIGMLQSKIDFRVDKLLTGYHSLWDFMELFKQTFGDAKQQNTLLAMDHVLQDVRPSIHDGENVVLRILSHYSDLKEQIKKCEIEKQKNHAVMTRLTDEVVSNREQIVKIQKISFKMRLDKAIKNIVSVSQEKYYIKVLSELNAEIEKLSAIVPVPRIDPETGLEIPYCQFSEIQLNLQLNTLVTACYQKHQYFKNLMQKISDYHLAATKFRRETLNEAIEDYCAASTGLVVLVKKLLENSENFSFSKDTRLFGIVTNEFPSDLSGREEVLASLSNRISTSVDLECYEHNLSLEIAKALTRFQQQDAIALGVIENLERTLKSAKAIEIASSEPSSDSGSGVDSGSGSEGFRLKLPDNCFESEESKHEFYLNSLKKLPFSTRWSQSPATSPFK
ncbi:uncharacterized protein LOC129583523 [Paramacrobiotus metropolitanus]|uniref:uncharacterized protein LOC129583523 n=1 Tax=Paramacrobiotus metropolitanus TaxID=2943436 RepID=UPI0024461DCC|nr:uncharacterized protein LOC129583523 [Paramacrobiotus metropolitanus]